MRIIFSKKDIEKITKDIGGKLTKDLSKEKRIPVICGIMKGSLNFMNDLIKNIKTDVFTDYIQVSSYSGNKTTGKVILKRDLTIDIKDRTLVLVEDVIDTGISMRYLIDFIKQRYQPKRILIVALFDKTYRRKEKIKCDYAGKTLNADDFLYGYGLDYNELGRHLPEVYGLNSDDVRKLQEKLEKD